MCGKRWVLNLIIAQINVEVYDDDDGIERESAFLLDYKGWWYEDWYYTDIIFDRIPTIIKTEPTEAQDSSEKGIEIEAVIGSPDKTANRDVIYSILRDTTNENWDAAEMKLLSAGNYPWVKPMLAWVQLRGRNLDSAVNTFYQVMNESPDESVKIWAQYYRANTYLRKGDFNTAKSLYNDLLSTSNFVVYWNSVTDLARCEERITGYNTAINVYSTALGRISHPLIMMELGRLYKRNRKYNEALSILNEVLSTTTDQEYRYYTYHEMIYIYLSMNNKNSALNCARQIISQKFGIKTNIAKIFEELKDYNQAFLIYDDIERAGINKRESEESQVRRAVIYSKIGELDKSLELARKLLKAGVCCKNERIMKSIIYSNYVK